MKWRGLSYRTDHPAQRVNKTGGRMEQTEMNTTAMRLLVWSGVVLVGALIIAQGLIMDFVPGPSPALSPEAPAQIFSERKSSILGGSILQIICWWFYATWSIPIILFIRKMERSTPIFTFASLVNVGGDRVPCGHPAAVRDPDHEQLGVVYLALHLALVLDLDVHHRRRHLV
ncbi:MAG: hypothetical protein ACT4PG_00060 [Panacagrimonas sp.]